MGIKLLHVSSWLALGWDLGKMPRGGAGLKPAAGAGLRPSAQQPSVDES